MGNTDGTDGSVRYEVADGIAYISLDRPAKLNALTDAMIAQLGEHLRRFDLDDAANVAVLRGEGRAFSSGADVKQRQLRPREELESFGVTSPDTRRMEWFEQTINSKPVVASVQGYALGIALFIALHADVVAVAEDAKLQVTEIPRGIGGGKLWALMHFRSPSAAVDELVFTGRVFTGREAEGYGLVNRAVPADQLQDCVRVRAGDP